MHGQTISDPISKANVLNSYFESVFNEEDIFTMGMWEEDGRWGWKMHETLHSTLLRHFHACSYILSQKLANHVKQLQKA